MFIICYRPGGGVVHFDDRRQRFFLRGIVGGSGREECGTAYFPNVYARLSFAKILTWVYQQAPAAADYQLAADVDTPGT